MKQKLGLLVLALLVVTTFIFWSRRWDNPALEQLPEPAKGEIVYRDRPIQIEIKCICPTALIESKKTYITFNVSLKWVYSPPEGPRELLYAYVDVGGATVEPAGMTAVADTGELKNGTAQSMSLAITPGASGPSQITFHFEHYVGEQLAAPLGTVSTPIDVRPSFARSVAPYAYSCLVFLCVGGIVAWLDVRQRRLKDQTLKQVEDAKNQWEKAQVKLEAYFDANLFQVGLVFWVAVTVMAVGFGFVLWGVLVSVRQPATLTSTSGVSLLSGIITEFIGATFMVIYRSTVAQANEFVSVLERISRVGIAMQVLNSISETGNAVKDEARAHVASSLIDAKFTISQPNSALNADDARRSK